jgi:hypothetical protein
MDAAKHNAAELREVTDSEARAIRDEAAKLASTYSIIFVGNRKPYGAGTLVSLVAVKGVLTAHHVLHELYKLSDEHISFCYRNTVPHRPTFARALFPVITVGDSSRNPKQFTGPDLALMVLMDPQLITALERLKTFYPLDCHDHYVYKQHDLRKLPCTLSGSPEEYSQSLGICRGEPLTKFSDYHASVDFLNIKNRKGFDYIRLKAKCSSTNFPRTYGGTSGGGIWLTVMQHSKLPHIKETYGRPVLLGVAFYEAAAKSNERVIIGHGPRSIFERTLEELAPWRH